jgi:hypothetical protein
MRRLLWLFVSLALTATFYCAQAQVITTVAGTDFVYPNQPLPGLQCGGALGNANGRERVRNDDHRWTGQPSDYDCDRVSGDQWANGASLVQIMRDQEEQSVRHAVPPGT